MATLATEISVTAAHRPGQLASLSAALGKAGINIASLTAHAAGRSGTIRLLFADKDVARARRTIEAAGFKLRKSDVRKVVLASMANKPGALSRITGRLAKAGLNLDSLYGAGATRKRVTIAIGVGKNAAKAKRALK